MTCKRCQSEIMVRKIPFGRVGYVEMEMCECEALRLTLKYQNSGKADNHADFFRGGTMRRWSKKLKRYVRTVRRCEVCGQTLRSVQGKRCGRCR